MDKLSNYSVMNTERKLKLSETTDLIFLNGLMIIMPPGWFPILVAQLARWIEGPEPIDLPNIIISFVSTLLKLQRIKS